MSEKKKGNFFEPFKEIPATLKTFPKGLIKLWKEPVKNSEEVAKRKKDLTPWMYFFCSLIAIGFLWVIIQVITGVGFFETIGNIFYIPGFVGAVYCGFLFLVAKKAAKKFADIECDNCKTRMPHSAMTDYKVLNTTYTVKKQKKARDKGGMNVIVTGTERVKVEINCICPKCGTLKTFVQEFRTAVCERRELGVSALNADLIMANFEKDVREEQKNRFDGSTGATTRGHKDVELCIGDYFGDIIQIG